MTNMCTPMKKVRIPFSEQEDNLVSYLVSLFGTRRWQHVAHFLKGRTAKQCRDRYTNYLMPGIKKGEWSKEEDKLIVQLFMQYGSKWSKIKKSFPQRSANFIKNRWNYFLSKQIEGENIDCQTNFDKSESESDLVALDHENQEFPFDGLMKSSQIDDEYSQNINPDFLLYQNESSFDDCALLESDILSEWNVL